MCVNVIKIYNYGIMRYLFFILGMFVTVGFSFDAAARKYHDAVVYGLRGNVKHVVCTSDNGIREEHFFNRNGQETNAGGEICDEYVYDSAGYPISSKTESSPDYTVFSYVMVGDNRLISKRVSETSSAAFTYSADGCCVLKITVVSFWGIPLTSIFACDEFEWDREGNWLKRNVKESNGDEGKDTRIIEYYGDTSESIDMSKVAKYKNTSFEISTAELLDGVFGIAPYNSIAMDDFENVMRKQAGWNCEFRTVRDNHIDVHVRERNSKFTGFFKRDVSWKGYNKILPYLLMGLGDDCGCYSVHDLNKKDANNLFDVILKDLEDMNIQTREVKKQYFVKFYYFNYNGKEYWVDISKGGGNVYSITLFVNHPVFAK